MNYHRQRNSPLRYHRI